MIRRERPHAPRSPLLQPRRVHKSDVYCRPPSVYGNIPATQYLMPKVTGRRCSMCSVREASVAERKGRGALKLCDLCDQWIVRRMGAIGVTKRRSSASRPYPEDEPAYPEGVPIAVALSGTPGVGEATIEKLEAAGCGTVDGVWEAGEEKVQLLDGIGEKTAAKIFDTLVADPDAGDDEPGLGDLFG